MIVKSRSPAPLTRKPDSSEVAEVFIMLAVLDSVPGDSWTASQPQDCGLTDPLRKEPDLDLNKAKVTLDSRAV